MRLNPVRLLLGGALLLVLLIVIVACLAWWLITPDRIRTTLEAQASAALGEQVVIRGLDVGWYPRVRLRLRDVRIGAPARMDVSELDVSTGLGGLLSRRVEEAELTIRKSRVDVPALLDLVSRIMAKPAAAQPESGASFAIVSVRAIALDDVTLAAGAQQAKADARGMLAGDALTLESLSAEAPGTKLTASGTIKFTPVDVALKADAATVDVDRLLGFVSAALPGGSHGPEGGTSRRSAHVALDIHAATGSVAGLAFSDLTTHADMRGENISLDIRAAKGSVAGLAFSDLTTHADMRGGNIALSPFRAALLGGRIDAKLVRTDAPVPRLDVSGSLQQVDASQVLAWLRQPTGSITGKMSGTVQLTGSGANVAVPDAWRGTARAVLADGTLKGLSVVRSAVVSLSRRGQVAMPSGADRYDRIDGNFVLQGNSVACRDLALHSPDLDLRGGGTLGVPDGSLDMKMQVALSPQLSAQAGRDLYRYAREGDRIVLPATIRGRVGSPSVTLDVADVAKRALQNKMQDEAGSLLNKFLKKKP